MRRLGMFLNNRAKEMELTMKNKQKAIISLIALLALGACATSLRPDVEKDNQSIVDTRTILDAHRPEITQTESRVLLYGEGGRLSPKEIDDIKSFAEEFITVGRGTVVISYPQGGGNSGAINALVRETQKQLYSAGVDFKKMSFGTFDATKDRDPVMVSFTRFQASEVDCVPWSQIDPRKTANNTSSVNFGCATNANVAAMLADPGDLNGDRKLDKDDASRTQNGIDKYRKGELPEVSGTVAGGGSK